MLATMIASALYSQQTFADDLMSQCLLGVPSYNRTLYRGADTNQLPITINSNAAKLNYPNSAQYTGNVDVSQGNSRLSTEELHLTQKFTSKNAKPTRTIDANGKVHYDDNQVILKGLRGWSDLDSKDTNIWQGNYQMVGQQGRGVADEMQLRGNNRFTILKNGSYTTCLPGDNSWSIEGSEIIEDREEQLAEIWNARFKIGSVPIFYSPYLQMPIGNKRRSGFLVPSIRYGKKNGFEFLLPYYWNIAPQADATIIPHLMTNRGLMLQNEFRYLTAIGSGLIELDYLGSDNQYEKDRAARSLSEDGSSKRWLFYWNHSGVYDQHWRFNADYTKVSDNYYFNDLTSPYYNSTDGYATQKFSFGFSDNNWNATLSTIDFQTFSQSSSNIYRAMPQLDINLYQNNIGPFDAQIYAQAVRLTNTNPRLPEATRLHFEPTITLPLSNGWANLNTEAKFLVTHYGQDNLAYYNSTSGSNELVHSVNRALPQIKVDGKVILERDLPFFDGYTQTVEPRIQYLYIPYRNQSNILSYDSTLLQSDYTGLFRDRIYSGLDRIASSNQLATGVTSRLYDGNMRERFNFSIGQIYLFTPARTGDNTSFEKDERGSLLWASDGFWQIDDYWGLRGGMQYDTRLANIAQSNGALEYRQDSNRVIQLNYRYSSPEYIAAALNQSSEAIKDNLRYRNGISQVGFTAGWPLADTWSVVGSYYYDTRNRQPAEQLLGLQYSSCCYALRIGFERKINGWQQNTSQYDNQISFNIEFRGIGANYGLGTQSMLRRGIIPYSPVF